MVKMVTLTSFLFHNNFVKTNKPKNPVFKVVKRKGGGKKQTAARAKEESRRVMMEMG